MKNIRNSFKVLFALVVLSFSVSFAQENMLSGSFVGADNFHQGAGGFELSEVEGQRILTLADDFSVTRGPDLFVWLVKGDNTKEFVNLGRLQNRAGTQQYEIPTDVNLDDFDRVIIWCRAFSVLFATAEFDVSGQ